MSDEQKQEIIDAYLQANPTPENSMDIVKQLAEEYEKSPNSIRMLLSSAKVYVKKTPSSGGSGGTTTSSTDKPTRKSKESSLSDLRAAIEKRGQDVNDEIISKLTGKAADYFANVISNI